MELLTQQLPSGHHYPFSAVHINPMKFAVILEYLENVPDKNKRPAEYFYFNYCVVKDDDPNIENLLLIDLEYVIYMKKAITISENLTFRSSIECPNCGETIEYQVSLAGVNWDKPQPEVQEGFQISFGGEMLAVKMPTVKEFMSIFNKYRIYKKNTDLKIIKLVSLFEQSQMYCNKIENLVVNATYKDVAALLMLDKVFFNYVKPKTLYCHKCIEMYDPTPSEIFDYKLKHKIEENVELLPEQLYEIKKDHGGVEIGMDSLVSEFFRDLYINNQLTSEEVLFGEVR